MIFFIGFSHFSFKSRPLLARPRNYGYNVGCNNLGDSADLVLMLLEHRAGDGAIFYWLGGLALDYTHSHLDAKER